MKIMAVDLGQVRTGLAVSDPTEQLASPVGTITEKNTDKLLEKVAAAAREQGVQQLVVGHPPDGRRRLPRRGRRRRRCLWCCGMNG